MDQNLMSQYLYAIASEGALASLNGMGLDQSPLYPVSQNGLVAIVSDISDRRLRPERKHLNAHQKVLSQLLESSTPLPMGFGMVSDGEAATRKLLETYREDFQEQLERVEGCVEMGLRIRWDVPNIFDFLLSRNSDLTEMRDQIRSLEEQHGPQHQSRIELGRRFEGLLEGEREQVDEQVCSILERVVKEFHRGKTRAENDILNLACLVDRRRQDEFVARVIEAASAFDANYAFDYNGPWAPHNFVSLNLSFEETA